ncbi:hypothetical protein [Priestia koreensis]|uniref:Uncharacterized protein n=1 Tax=Priestia koreensis TaxID=284581 RepID=A0A0M0L6U3_9BACI|nr:hypothetical protein [Priestia koreensis]KOO46388.1 hypothetical protein AMD01_11145 [Priestia koreensis]
MPKKSTEIKNIYMTFVGRPSEEAIENFVKQIFELDEMIKEKRRQRERENSLNSNKGDNKNA